MISSVVNGYEHSTERWSSGRHPSGQTDMNDQRHSRVRGPFGLRDWVDVWVTELRGHEAPSQGVWERGRGSWSDAQGGHWCGMSRANRAEEGLGPGNRGTGPGTFERV